VLVCLGGVAPIAALAAAPAPRPLGDGPPVVVAVLASTLPRWRDGALLRAARRGWAERCQQRRLEVPEGTTAVVGLVLMRSWVLLQDVPMSASAWQHQSTSRPVTDRRRLGPQKAKNNHVNRHHNASPPTAASPLRRPELLRQAEQQTSKHTLQERPCQQPFEPNTLPLACLNTDMCCVQTHQHHPMCRRPVVCADAPNVWFAACARAHGALVVYVATAS
jgi:hypothetical protein